MNADKLFRRVVEATAAIGFVLLAVVLFMAIGESHCYTLMSILGVAGIAMLECSFIVFLGISLTE